MKSQKTIIGLLMFLFYSASGNITVTLMSCSILGILFLITGLSAFHTFFIIMMVVMPPYSVITSIAGGYVSKYSAKWEGYQLAMPVKRRDVTSAQYLCVIIASLAGLPFIVIIMGISLILHKSLSEIAGQVITSTVSIFSISIGIALLLGALFFPLTCMKISKNRGEALSFICVTAALGIIALVSWAGFSMELSQYFISLLRITVSAVPFILSFLLTRKLYMKLDL